MVTAALICAALQIQKLSFREETLRVQDTQQELEADLPTVRSCALSVLPVWWKGDKIRLTWVSLINLTSNLTWIANLVYGDFPRTLEIWFY